MFSIGGGEMLVIGVVALIVVGPKDLPRLFRSSGQFIGRMQGMANEFRRTMENAADEAGASELRAEVDALNHMTQDGMTGKDPLGLNAAGEKLRKLNNIGASADELAADLDNELQTANAAAATKAKAARAKKDAPKATTAESTTAKATTAKKPAAKKTITKKAAAQKTVTRTTATKKTAPKKATAKKTAAKTPPKPKAKS